MRCSRIASLAGVMTVLAAAGIVRPAVALTACTAADIVAQDPGCPSSGACTITKTFSVGTGCVLDFGARAVTIGNNGRLNIGSGAVTIKGASVTLGTGAFIDGRGISRPTSNGGFLTVQATVAIMVLKSPLGTGRVDVSANNAAGSIQCSAGTSIAIDGSLHADSLTAGGSGGLIDLSAGQDITSTAGSTISAAGGLLANGEVDMTTGGRVDLGDTVNVNGQNGGTVIISSGTDTVLSGVTAKGTGSGSGSSLQPGAGGSLNVAAGTQLQVNGSINADGTGGGCGGAIDLAANFGDLVIAQSVSADAALPDHGGGGGLLTLSAVGSVNIHSGAAVTAISVGNMGFGGSVCVDASHGVDISTAAPLDASGGCGGCVLADARGSLTLNGGARANANAFGGIGGMITLTAGDLGVGTLSVGSTVDVSGGPCSAGAGCGPAGCTLLEGCDVTVTAGGTLDARGPGGGGVNTLTAHEQLSIAGSVVATSTSPAGTDGMNQAAYPSRKPPVIGGLVQPAAALNPEATCADSGQTQCLVPCPVCGDGVVEFPETCDNAAGPPLSCDGCSRFCQTENCNDNNACTLDSCDPLLGCRHLLQPPCPTSTPTAPPTATPTATPVITHAASGHIRYRTGNLGVPNASVHLSGPTPQATVTDANGAYTFNGLDSATWVVQPEKHGDVGTAIGTLDAVKMLQAAVGLFQPDANQKLACDVSGNGIVSALDAVFILQQHVGLIQTLPVVQTCGAEWAFVPAAAPVMGTQQMTPPVITGASCQPGTIALSALTGDAVNQDFAAVLLGDCDGSWQPSAGGGAVASAGTRACARGSARVLYAGRARRLRDGRSALPLLLSPSFHAQAVDAEVAYDPGHARFLGVRRLGGVRGGVMAVNGSVPGTVRLAAAAAVEIGGTEPLALLVFDAGGGDVGEISLHSVGYTDLDSTGCVPFAADTW